MSLAEKTVPRRVIQFSACGVENTDETQCSVIYTALCDDGTMWVRRGFGEWRPVPAVPPATGLEALGSLSAREGRR